MTEICQPKSLAERVVSAFCAASGASEPCVTAIDNSSKYECTSVDPRAGVIFEKLAAVNSLALEDDDLCRGNGASGLSFRDALSVATERLASLAEGRELLYVELGPEPIKTTFILRQLLKRGFSVRYCGIDINRYSAESMRGTIGKLIPEDRFRYFVGNYNDITSPDVHGLFPGDVTSDSLAVVTSLGWQEGNEHPKDIHGVYRRLLRSNDLLFSEMQLLEPANHFPLHAFWHQPKWREVSSVFRERSGRTSRSQFGTVLIPVDLEEFGSVMCAVATESSMDEARGSIDISNYCLKFTDQQLHTARSMAGFRVIDRVKTGDGSVAFDIAGLSG